MARKPPYAVAYYPGHTNLRFPALLLDWRCDEVRPGVVSWHALIAIAREEVLTPMVPFEMRVTWVLASHIEPVTDAVAWMPDLPQPEPDWSGPRPRGW